MHHSALWRSLLTLLLLTGPGVLRAETALPTNDWSRVDGPSPGPSAAIGFYSRGCLAGGKALPIDGVGYEAIRLERRRMFGHPAVIDFIQSLGARGKAEGLPRFRVGDVAQARGGPLPYGHLSHETGLDADIWFTFDTGPLPPPGQRDFPELGSVLTPAGKIDPHLFGRGQVELLRLAAADPRVDRIFVNPAIKRALCDGYGKATSDGSAWLRLLRPWYGHDDHFHVRLRCPDDSPDCESQEPVGPGDGCDADLDWGRPNKTPPKPPVAAPVRPQPPAACMALLKQP
jgi:penicillin-insensitive murein DD-endopeptidase